jgi:hypothetical protein
VQPENEIVEGMNYRILNWDLEEKTSPCPPQRGNEIWNIELETLNLKL